MLKKLSRNYMKYLNLYKGFAIFSAVTFLILGTATESSILFRPILVAMLLIVGFIYYKAFDFSLRKHRKKITWDKMKKTLDFQLSFFFYFGLLGTIQALLFAFINPREIPLALLYSSITLGLMISTLRNKAKYIYADEFNKENDKGNKE